MYIQSNLNYLYWYGITSIIVTTSIMVMTFSKYYRVIHVYINNIIFILGYGQFFLTLTFTHCTLSTVYDLFFCVYFYNNFIFSPSFSMLIVLLFFFNTLYIKPILKTRGDNFRLSFQLKPIWEREFIENTKKSDTMFFLASPHSDLLYFLYMHVRG